MLWWVELLGITATHTEASAIDQANEQQNKYKQIFGSRAVQLMAFFIWVYVGAEVTIGGKVLVAVVVFWLIQLYFRMDCHCEYLVGIYRT